mgnify:CR=1 FL=1
MSNGILYCQSDVEGISLLLIFIKLPVSKTLMENKKKSLNDKLKLILFSGFPILEPEFICTKN